MHARQAERAIRALEQPIVGSLPDGPGILAAMMISSSLSAALRELADVLLVHPFPGSTLTRSDRELIATAVSAGNDCFFCMDSHAAFAEALLQSDGIAQLSARNLTNAVKNRQLDALSEQMKQLVSLALIVREGGRKLTTRDVAAARDAGATDQDVHLAVLISSAFCMYNRIVDGFRAHTPSDAGVYVERALQIAEYGYADRGILPKSSLS